MKLVNNLMKAPEMATTMQEFSKEMTKVSFSIGTISNFLFGYEFRGLELTLT